MLLKFITPLFIIKAVVFIMLTHVFINLFSEDLQKFNNKMTTTGIKRRPGESKPLPCITFCPLQGFKTKGFFYTNQSYLENSFSPEELFHLDSLQIFQNKSKFVFKEVRTILNGRCYTLCSSFTDIGILVTTNFNFIIFIHNDGDEFWVIFGLSYLFDMADTIIQLNRTDGINIGKSVV